jgi:hypothetical protein
LLIFSGFQYNLRHSFKEQELSVENEKTNEDLALDFTPTAMIVTKEFMCRWNIPSVE